MHSAVRFQLDHPKPDAVLNIESHLFNFTICADTCDYELDVGRQLWLNKQRWSRLIREYVAKDALDRFVSQAKEIYTGQARDGATANFLFRDPDRYAKKHRWGGCLMGATFRGDKKRAHIHTPTLTFFSRTTYIGYMGLLDACIASCMAREITDQTIAFRWVIASSQLHCFKTLPFIYSQPDLMKKLEKYAKNPNAPGVPPTWKHMAKWYLKVLKAYDDHGIGMLDVDKYGPFRRIKRRWLEYKGHLKKDIPPSLTPDQLDFGKAD